MPFFKRFLCSFLLFSFFIGLNSFALAEENCNSYTRKNITKSDQALYDSLLATDLYKFHGRIIFISDSIRITDSVRIKPLPIDTGSGVVYYPDYLQFKGSFRNFIKYILIIDHSIDSVVCCGGRVKIYAANKCDFCDSGFFAPTQYFPTQFHYYRFHEIYQSFFAYKNVTEIQVFVEGVNKTYLPAWSDIPVYAPNKTIKRKHYVSDTDYARFFPDDFPENSGSYLTVEPGTGDYVWIERVASKKIKSVKR